MKIWFKNIFIKILSANAELPNGAVCWIVSLTDEVGNEFFKVCTGGTFLTTMDMLYLKVYFITTNIYIDNINISSYHELYQIMYGF